MFLEETGLPYTVKPVNISQAASSSRPTFLDDRAEQPDSGDRRSRTGASAVAPVSLFESGAILLYLADKTGKPDSHGRHARWRVHPVAVLADGEAWGRWLGQNHHFAQLRDRARFPTRSIATSMRPDGFMQCSIDSCADREFIVDSYYSIADMRVLSVDPARAAAAEHRRASRT